MKEQIAAVVQFFVLTAVTILAKQFINTKAAIAIMVVGGAVLLAIHWEKFKDVQAWALANKTTTILSCTLAGALIGLGGGLLMTLKVNAQQGETKTQDNKNSQVTPTAEAPQTAEQKTVSAAPRKTKAATPKKKSDSVSVGDVSQGPGSVAQIGGSGNKAVVNSLGSIINQDSTINAPQTINNFGPPPLEIGWDSNSVKSDKSEYAYATDVIVRVNTAYTPVSLAVVCDSEIREISPSVMAMMGVRIGISNSKTVGLLSFMNPPITPETPLTIRVYANQPFKVTNVQRWAQTK